MNTIEVEFRKSDIPGPAPRVARHEFSLRGTTWVQFTGSAPQVARHEFCLPVRHHTWNNMRSVCRSGTTRGTAWVQFAGPAPHVARHEFSLPVRHHAWHGMSSVCRSGTTRGTAWVQFAGRLLPARIYWTYKVFYVGLLRTIIRNSKQDKWQLV
jgi:hypothetical protein